MWVNGWLLKGMGKWQVAASKYSCCYLMNGHPALDFYNHCLTESNVQSQNTDVWGLGVA